LSCLTPQQRFLEIGFKNVGQINSEFLFFRKVRRVKADSSARPGLAVSLPPKFCVTLFEATASAAERGTARVAKTQGIFLKKTALMWCQNSLPVRGIPTELLIC